MSLNYSQPEKMGSLRQDDPSVPEIIEDITTFLMVAHIVGLIVFLLTTTKYFIFIPTILRNTPKKFISRTLFLCGFYSILSASAYTSMMVPRAFLFCDGITLVTFGIAVYEFFCLCIDYAGGETKFITKANGEEVLSMKTFPFCCCCFFLKPMTTDKKKFTILRLMNLQLPILLMLIYFVVLVIQMEDTALYHRLSTFILPFIGVGAIISAWAAEMVMAMFTKVLPGYNIKQKHISVALVLLFCKFQPLIAQIEFSINGETWQQYPITKGIFSNTIIQLLMIIQMFLLSIWSHCSYKTPSGRCASKEIDDV
ncbi:Organic solute transporter alpha-like protein [Pseudolycoriella hygida]|uniref:Organic solute transporter alpha-like protein n=1 Tax=Pseudolycoriella hygida TaxID=35572 RepID=A0A9Q0RUS2_9DIPT|nr:Organic solute transporter alpha-like protein [Pseudolycoriella hygida]